MKRQSGFTIIEFAIVMVVFGILISIVIKGGSLIDNARIRSLYSLKDSISRAVYGYYEQYSYFPGDDPKMLMRWPALAANNGNGNGVVATGLNSTAPASCTSGTSEQCSLWSALRQAGFLSGAGFTNPNHPYHDRVSVTFYTDPSWGASALIAHWMVFVNVPGNACDALDRQYDDGNWQTGIIRGSAAYTSSALNLYFKL